MTFVKFILIIVVVYTVYYGINIIFDLIKQHKGTAKSTINQTIEVIGNTVPISNDNVQEQDVLTRNQVISKRISLTDFEEEYKKHATDSTSEHNSHSTIIADLGIEDVKVNAGISVFELHNQNLDNYVID